MLYIVIMLIAYALGFFAGIMYALLKHEKGETIEFHKPNKKHVLTDDEIRDQVMHDNVEAFGTTTHQKDVI